jgi:hypothetical protein
MARHDLPGGNWVEIRDTPTNGGRRRAWAAFSQARLEGLIGNMQDMATMDELLVDMVDAWSLPEPVPREEREVLDSLDLDLANGLYALLLPLVKEGRLNPDFGVDPADDSPTSPSSN